MKIIILLLFLISISFCQGFPSSSGRKGFPPSSDQQEYSAYFNTGDGSNDYLTIGSILDDIASAANDSAFSISCWMKRGATGNADYIFGNYYTSSNWLIVRLEADGDIMFRLRVGGADAPYIVSSDTPTNDTDWHYITIVHGNDDSWIFVDGAEVTAYAIQTVGAANYSGGAGTIGTYRTSTGYNVNTYIDELALWKGTVLTLANHIALYNNGGDASSLSPDYYWKFEQDWTDTQGNQDATNNNATFSTEQP